LPSANSVTLARVAGYSGTPLPKKLGIAAGSAIALLGAPKDFAGTLGALPPGVTTANSLRGSRSFDVIVFFPSSRAELERRFVQLASRITQAGGLWIAWPKKSSGVASDFGEDTVRATAIAAGLVDNKVCAIDEVRSGLRCVIRKANRR
jgi:hypothetical protein